MAIDLRQIGNELGVPDAIEGASSRRLRIKARLLDAQNGVHVWGRRFVRNRLFPRHRMNCSFDLAKKVDGEVNGAEARRAKRPGLASRASKFNRIPGKGFGRQQSSVVHA
jgi:hypothetical protein